jgi:hypothetical protein
MSEIKIHEYPGTLPNQNNPNAKKRRSGIIKGVIFPIVIKFPIVAKFLCNFGQTEKIINFQAPY